jgi:uncharacterized protein Yka (UPF0111/DUF47 family)
MGHDAANDGPDRRSDASLLEVVRVSPSKMRWFLPESPDVLGMLHAQASVTIEGMDALVAWAAGNGEAVLAVREAEHAADHKKRELQLALKTAFTTPIDSEDVYAMSSLLDEVLNAAKDAVRESEVMAIPPDDHIAAMAGLLSDGVHHLADAFDRLSRSEGKNGPESTDAADAAVKAQRHVERVYRTAMSSLLSVEDLREVIGKRELYRRLSRISEVVVACAERVWYAQVKES